MASVGGKCLVSDEKVRQTSFDRSSIFKHVFLMKTENEISSQKLRFMGSSYNGFCVVVVVVVVVLATWLFEEVFGKTKREFSFFFWWPSNSTENLELCCRTHSGMLYLVKQNSFNFLEKDVHLIMTHFEPKWISFRTMFWT